jgi:hypothetical protein
VVVSFGLLLLLTNRRGRPLGAVGLAVLLGVGVALSGGRPASAHDPGQGQPVASVRLTGTSDGHRTLSLTLDAAPDCDQLAPVRLVARRAGHSLAAPVLIYGLAWPY